MTAEQGPQHTLSPAPPTEKLGVVQETPDKIQHTTPETQPTEQFPTHQIESSPSWRRIGITWLSAITVGVLSAKYGSPVVNDLIQQLSDDRRSSSTQPYSPETTVAPHPSTNADTKDTTTKDTYEAKPPNQDSTETTAPSPEAKPVEPPKGFLTRSGNKLMLDGKQYRGVGINAHQMGGTTYDGDNFTKKEIDNFMKALPPLSPVRTWVWAGYNEKQFANMVKSAEEHRQLLIPTFYEGAGWDRKDPNVENAKDSAWYTHGFKSHIATVAKTVNTYKDSKAIGMWEVSNEAGGAENENKISADAMFSFFKEVSSVIKKNDPNHLVSTGAHDCYNGGGWGEANCKRINSLPEIDVMSIHDYSWRREGKIIGDAAINSMKITKSINKPILIGEMAVGGGMSADCERSDSERIEIYKKKFVTFFNNPEVAGITVWRYMKQENCTWGGLEDHLDNDLNSGIFPLFKAYTEKNLGRK